MAKGRFARSRSRRSPTSPAGTAGIRGERRHAIRRKRRHPVVQANDDGPAPRRVRILAMALLFQFPCQGPCCPAAIGADEWRWPPERPAREWTTGIVDCLDAVQPLHAIIQFGRGLTQKIWSCMHRNHIRHHWLVCLNGDAKSALSAHASRDVNAQLRPRAVLVANIRALKTCGCAAMGDSGQR